MLFPLNPNPVILCCLLSLIFLFYIVGLNKLISLLDFLLFFVYKYGKIWIILSTYKSMCVLTTKYILFETPVAGVLVPEFSRLKVRLSHLR